MSKLVVRRLYSITV